MALLTTLRDSKYSTSKAEEHKLTQPLEPRAPVPTEKSSDTSSDPKMEYDEDLHVVALQNTTEAKLMRKIDFRVVPCLCVLYLLAFLDRYVCS